MTFKPLLTRVTAPLSYSAIAGIVCLALLGLPGCGGGDGGADSVAASSQTNGSSDAALPSDLHIQGKLVSYNYGSSTGLTSVVATVDIAPAGLMDSSCAVDATIGLTLVPNTSVAVAAKQLEDGSFSATQIACQPRAGFLFEKSDSKLRIVGKVTGFTGVFRQLVPSLITVSSPTISTVGAKITGCEPDSNFKLPPSIVLDAVFKDSGYIATRVTCSK